jgi:hypothetical protein
MGELIDMEIVGEKSSHETGIGNSRRTSGMEFEKGDRVPSDLKEALAPWQYQGQGGGFASPMVKRREFLPNLEGIQYQWHDHLKLAEERFGYPPSHLQYGSRPLIPNPRMKTPDALEPTFEQLKYKLDQTKNHLEKGELLEEQRALGLGAWPNQLVVELVKAAQFAEQLQLQPEFDQDEEDLREFEALKAMQLARRASKANQQDTQQRIFEERNKYLK